MEMSESLNERLEVAKRRLLEEGASSYLQAIVALNEFSREVQRTCRDVLRRGLPGFREAIDLDLDESQIYSRPFPETISQEEWMADEGTSLGAGINFKDHRLTLAVELCWELGESSVPSLVASASIYPWNKGQLQSAWPKFEKSHAMKYERPYSYCIYFSESVLPNEMSTFDDKLARVLHKLIRAWGEAGGLKAFRG